MFEFIFTIVPILVLCIFGFTFALIFSPKLRGKMMSKQMKSLKYMIDESKEDLVDIATTSIRTQKNIIDNNEETLKDMATKRAKINSEGIETTVKAIKKGITENKVYCKYCGMSIDEDSKYCKKCGKEQ